MSGMRATLEQLNPRMRKQAMEKIALQPRAVTTHLIEGKGDLQLPKPTKYKNRRCVFDGQNFDSLKEANRWRELRLLEHAGEIKNLRRQVPFELKVKYRLICTYIADFVYSKPGERVVVEDVKGMKKGVAYRLFQVKAALMLAIHNYKVHEV